MRAVGYARVSTEEQGESGAGLRAQANLIHQEALRRGWELLEVVEDAGVSGKSVSGRPGLARALELVESDEADGIVVAKLDRLSRSLLDFVTLVERSRRNRWVLVALDVQIDTSTPAGEMMANIVATFSQYERRLIGQRTKDALAVKRREGVRLGRPPSLSDEVRERIRVERAKGRTLAAIADGLEADGVATAQGGRRWYPATVRAVLARENRLRGDLSPLASS